MASKAFLEKAYLAYFGRPVDPTGAVAFANSTEAEVAAAFSASPESKALFGPTFGAAQINLIYLTLFGRPAETAGIDYWLHQVELGLLTPTGAAMGIMAGARNADITAAANKLAASATFTAGIDTAAEIQGYAGNDAAAAARDFLKSVTSTAATQTQIDSAIEDTVAIGNNTVGLTFTLTESIVKGQAAVVGEKVIYWGYNPNTGGATSSETSTDGIEDGGVPVSELIKFVTTITGLDLKELGLIDADGVDPFLNVTSLTLSNPLSTGAINGEDNDSTNVLTIGFLDGSFLNAEVALGAQYFDFLNGLLFDAEGNSRLFEKEIGAKVAKADTLQSIKLTPSVNNGGTLEGAFVTTAGDDIIVAGRLELLHGAYIDGGKGYNVLEIDAKGTYAQPAELLRIQEVRVNDLPNFYTTDGTDENGLVNNGYLENSSYPFLSASVPSDDSWIDLSRATSIEKLVVNAQGTGTGDLTIVGVRNSATARLEGNFQDNVTLQYGQGQTGTLNLELALGDVTGDINLLQNAAVLNIDSQGVENHMASFFAGGNISRMIVKGAGVFGVDANLASSFHAGRPAIIDASANTGGLDVTLNSHYNVKVTGTQADDEITTTGSTKVVIAAGNGDNTIVTDGSKLVTISSGAGSDTISATNAVEVTIIAGEGKNVINTNGSTTVDITTGTGNDTITSTGGKSVSIDAGAGNNVITTDNSATVSITTGAGNDTISSVRGNVVTIDAGAGTNKITVSANEITVTTGVGDDKLYVSGMDSVFDNGDLTEGSGSGAGGFNTGNLNNIGLNGHFADSLAPGALLNLNLGGGINTVYLGRDFTDNITAVQHGITALEGSTITGTGIKLYVENNSDLTQADLTGATITSVALKQELRITDDQFTGIGANNFSVVRDEEGATEDLYIVVDSSTSLTAMLAGKALSTSVRLHVELTDGATLSVTAEQLHKQFAEGGISGIDGLNGKLVITDAGLNFDAFSNGADYLVIDGGSVVTAGGLTLADTNDVTIIRSVSGFERPAPAASTDVLTIDSNVTPSVTAAIISEVATLKIVGTADIAFNKAIDLGRDATAAVLADGRLGDLVSPETDAFTIDFSALTGKLSSTTTIANFQDVKAIKGNGSATNDVRLNVELTNGSSVGSTGNANGLNSTGVQTYVVTAIGDDSVGEDAAASSATFNVCDLSADVKVLGLRGNFNDTINFKQVNWGTNFLLEGGGTAKADGNPTFSNVGTLNAEYFWTGAEPHANAVVNIVNLDTGTTVRPLNVAGIDIKNADSITVNVTGNSDLVLQSISGNSVEALTFAAAGNVTLRGDLQAADVDSKGLKVLDASDVDGVFALQLSNAGLTTDLSKTVVTGLDKVVFDAVGTSLTLTVDQAVALGAANVTTTTGVTGSTLNFADLGSQAIDMTAFGAKNIGTVSIADVNGSVTLDAGTVLGNTANNADSLNIKAVLNDTTVKMTAAQFNQLAGAGTVTASLGTDTSNGQSFKAGLVLDGVTAATVLDLSAVATNVGQTVQLGGIVAASTFAIANGAASNNVVLEVSGVNDLTKVATGNLEAVGKVNFAANGTLTLTAAQLAAIPFTDANGDGAADFWTVAPGAVVKLNITDVATGFDLNLSLLEKAGVDIGTLTLRDSNGAVSFGANANLGNADAIVTPTKAAGDAVEVTTVSLSATQFSQLAGAGTISGDAKVSLTGLVNNIDANGDIVVDTKDAAVIDVSGITAPKGTVTLGASTVTLDAASSLAGFEIVLATGQMIKFSTAAQASAKISEAAPGATTAVAWLFETLTTPVNTSNYSSAINTLFINEDLVDGKVEESLWTTLASTITVEKVNKEGIPDVLVAFDRTNTFEAMTAIAGVNYDNQAAYESTANLTINLEGNTNIGNVTVGDTNVVAGNPAVFASLTVNSYEDRSTLPVGTAYVLQPNTIGNISLNAGSVDELVNVTLNTVSFNDAVNVNGPAVVRDGLALKVGTISFGANTTKGASLTLTGAKDITIAGVDISDTDVNLLTLNASTHTGALSIANIQPTGGDAASNALGSFGFIYLVDGYTAPAAAFGAAGNNLLVVTGGNNDLSAATITAGNIDQVHFTGNGTLTLTADQVQAIGFFDGTDVDTAADAWSTLAGLNIKLNIVGMASGNNIDFNAIAAAGIDIGTITMAAGPQTLFNLTTLGEADSIIIPADGILNLTAAQFEQLAGNGTITTTGLNGTVDHRGLVNVTDLTDAQGSINLSDVTAKNGTITLSSALVTAGGTDVALTAAAVLNGFSVTLNDIDSDLNIDNQLAGQTIRFATALQAERAILVTGPDSDGAANNWTGVAGGYFERDTNVIWTFNTITGTANPGVINTNGYSGALGRVWVNDALVNGVNVESIFSSPSAVLANPTTGLVNLNSTTIIRVVNTAALSTVLPTDITVNRTVEIEAYTQLAAGLIFSNPDKLVGVENLTIELGGAVTMGAISIDDIVLAAVNNPAGNEFGTLTINSKLATATVDTYLLPELFDQAVNFYPTAANTVGNISSGPTRGELASVTINATGVSLNTGTITFSDDAVSPSVQADPTAVLTVTGSKNVNIQSVNTNDVEITALTVNTTGYTGVLTAPGASPALQLDNTQTLTFNNGDSASGIITLGSAVNAGVAGNELSFINATNFDGTLNLGMLARIDSTNDDLNADGDVLDAGENIAFSFVSGQGITTATLAAANGLTPTLNAGSEWSFDYTGALAGSYLKITSSAVFTAGSTLRLNNVPVVIEGAVNLTQLVDTVGTAAVEGLFITDSTIEVLAGSSLTLSPAQVRDLADAGIDLFGAGTVKLVGDASNFGPLGGNIHTVGVDLSGVTLIASPAAGFDSDATVEMYLDDANIGTLAASFAAGHTVIGSANKDVIGMFGTKADTFTGGAGDDTIYGGAGNDTYNVDAGTDTIQGLTTGDVLVVSAGATAQALVASPSMFQPTIQAESTNSSFVATAATVNNGTAELTSAGEGYQGRNVIDVSLATGSNGFTLMGVDNGLYGADVLTGSNQADVINGGNNNQTNGAAVDTLTGNGGNDIFQFNIVTSTPAVMTNAIQIPLPIDREYISTFATDDFDDSTETLTINYTLNGIGGAPLVIAANAFDSASESSIESAIAAAMNGLAGISASVDLGEVVVSGDDRGSLTINGVNLTGAGWTDGWLWADDYGDVAQIERLDIAATAVTAGDVYKVLLTLAEGNVIGANYTAVGGDTNAQVAIGLANAFNAVAADLTVNAEANFSLGSWGITFADENGDNGGFVLSHSSDGTYGGSGASDIGAFDLTTADVITDFLSGTDKIDLNIAAGSSANYDEAAAFADFVSAKGAATAAFDGTVQYFLTSSTADATGLLFFDANADGAVDGVIKLVGVTEANFAASDIVA